MINWKILTALQRGGDHIRENTPCQDSICIEDNGSCLVAALSDGIGSLDYSHEASAQVTSGVVQWFQENTQRLKQADKTTNSDGKILQELIPFLQKRVRQHARQMQFPVEMMDCNLAFVCIVRTEKGVDLVYTGRLGDCALCLISDDSFVDTSQFIVGSITDTIMDPNAGSRLHLNRACVEPQHIYGFILTTDGLENEIYMKGSSVVLKNAEHYYNLLHQENAQQLLDHRLKRLSNYGYYTDDMSIIILSRDSEPRTFADDPRWLCTCGHYNRVTTLCCENCNADYTAVYQNVDMGNCSDRAKFFQKLNQDPAREHRLLGIAAKPLPAAPEAPQNTTSPANEAAADQPEIPASVTTDRRAERSVTPVHEPTTPRRSAPSSRGQRTAPPEPPSADEDSVLTETPDPLSARADNHKVRKNKPQKRFRAILHILFRILLLTICTVNLVLTCLLLARINALSVPEKEHAAFTEYAENDSNTADPQTDSEEAGLSQAEMDRIRANSHPIILTGSLKLRSEPTYYATSQMTLSAGESVWAIHQEEHEGISWVQVLTADDQIKWCVAYDLYAPQP